MALVATGLPAHMRIVVVPDGEPRTKPRALNYALTFAEGDYVVVYDAEDEPEPDQLRRALVLLRSEPDRIGCVQARLNVYNAGTSWFTRQFAIEYSCLFDALLPALERLDLPVPLGGTSNHFPRRVLEEVGGWDPYNVTEDADLGIRLVRKGRRIAVLRSTTWEEAPPTWAVWFPQRTRWLKGWMQTMIVHTRQPACLAAELGPWRTAGLVLLMGGLIVSALLHPWFYLAICIGWWQGGLYWPTTTLQSVLLGIALFNLIAGYAAAMVLGVFAVHARGFSGLGRQTLWVVVYWLAISIAAHRALWQLVRAPHLWEKTPHTSRGGRPGA
jgi:cellulose synthase/poly-beta-1,6-N-acetylglucosamine synthase-like glycosyltransferase